MSVVILEEVSEMLANRVAKAVDHRFASEDIHVSPSPRTQGLFHVWGNDYFVRRVWNYSDEAKARVEGFVAGFVYAAQTGGGL